MKTRLAENIRLLRKRQGLTQEQLAEVLGVTVGSVHEWETRMSTPELGMITEMADFFDVSVDVLLGYQMRDNRLKATVDRLWKASGTKDYDMLTEAEKAMQKYPNSFDVVWAGA
ncbi:MAG: helix-turn-helix transcriptional regulator, partial [Clostridia bacterium]|nr:helix-turn-helix transcriptional regulator [Clostridia bacterium]